MRLFHSLLATWVALLACFQYVTMTKLAVLPAAVTYASLGQYVHFLRDKVVFGIADLVLAVATILTTLALLILEVHSRQLTLFLRRLFVSDRRSQVILLVASLVCVRAYFGPGNLSWSADASVHIFLTDLAKTCFSLLQGPWWTFSTGMGSPLMQMYGFGFYILSGLTSLWIDNTLAIKLTLGGCHAVSGVGVFALARKMQLRRSASFIAGLAFVLCFWHTQQILFMGRHPVALVYALLPWVFYGSPTLCRRVEDRLPHALLAGSALGLVVLTHPGYGYWSGAFLVVFLALQLVWKPDHIRLQTCVAYMLASLATAAVIGGSLLLPMWVDRSFTGLAQGFDLFVTPDPAWWTLFAWSNYKFSIVSHGRPDFNWYGGYLGISLCLLAIMGMGLTLHRRLRRVSLPVLLLLTATFVMVLAYHSGLVQMLPGSEFLGAGRYLVFTTLFLALGAGMGVQFLQVAWRRQSQRVATFALLLVCLDLFPTTFQQPFFARPDSVDPRGTSADFYDDIRQEALKADREGEIAPFRSAYVGIFEFLTHPILHFYAESPGPDGPLAGEMLGVYEFVRPILDV